MAAGQHWLPESPVTGEEIESVWKWYAWKQRVSRLGCLLQQCSKDDWGSTKHDVSEFLEIIFFFLKFQFVFSVFYVIELTKSLCWKKNEQTLFLYLCNRLCYNGFWLSWSYYTNWNTLFWISYITYIWCKTYSIHFYTFSIKLCRIKFTVCFDLAFWPQRYLF